MLRPVCRTQRHQVELRGGLAQDVPRAAPQTPPELGQIMVTSAPRSGALRGCDGTVVGEGKCLLVDRGGPFLAILCPRRPHVRRHSEGLEPKLVLPCMDRTTQWPP